MYVSEHHKTVKLLFTRSHFFGHILTLIAMNYNPVILHAITNGGVSP